MEYRDSFASLVKIWTVRFGRISERIRLCKEEGEKQAKKFFEERVLTNEKQIYDRINLNKRRNFSKPTVDKNTGKVR